MYFIIKPTTLLETRIKTKKKCISYQNLKPIYRIQHKKRVEAEKTGDQNGKALFKVMKNAICGKTMENLKNRIDEKLVNNKKDY